MGGAMAMGGVWSLCWGGGSVLCVCGSSMIARVHWVCFVFRACAAPLLLLAGVGVGLDGGES